MGDGKFGAGGGGAEVGYFLGEGGSFGERDLA